MTLAPRQQDEYTPPGQNLSDDLKQRHHAEARGPPHEIGRWCWSRQEAGPTAPVAVRSRVGELLVGELTTVERQDTSSGRLTGRYPGAVPAHPVSGRTV